MFSVFIKFSDVTVTIILFSSKQYRLKMSNNKTPHRIVTFTECKKFHVTI